MATIRRASNPGEKVLRAGVFTYGPPKSQDHLPQEWNVYVIARKAKYPLAGSRHLGLAPRGPRRQQPIKTCLLFLTLFKYETVFIIGRGGEGVWGDAVRWQCHQQLIKSAEMLPRKTHASFSDGKFASLFPRGNVKSFVMNFEGKV